MTQKRHISIAVLIFAIGFFLFLKTEPAHAAFINPGADFTPETGQQAADELNQCGLSCPAPGECGLVEGSVRCFFSTEEACKTSCAADQFCAKSITQKYYCEKLAAPEPSKLDNLMSDLNARKPILEINIPGLNFSDVASTTDETGTYFYIAWIPQLISALYKFGIAIVSIVAVVVIIIQGLRIVTSGGGEAKASAYKKILQSVIGLMIAWGSYAILYNINPALVQFNALKVQVIQGIPFDDSRTDLDITPDEIAAFGSRGCEGTGGVVLYKQFDARWKILNGCPSVNTMTWNGCGPTAASMVMTKYGANLTPPQLEKAYREAGYKSCITGTGGGAFTNKTILDSLGLKTEVIKGKTKQQRIIQLLSAGKPVIVGVGGGSIFTAGGHYIVLTGINADGTLTVNDPNKCDYDCTSLKTVNKKKVCAGDKIDPPLTGASIPQKYVWPFLGGAYYIYPADDFLKNCDDINQKYTYNCLRST